MYILQTGLVLIAVYLAPALAVAPSLAFNPRTAVAIPFISVLLVFALHTALVFVGLYQPILVQILSGVFIAVATLRIYRIKISGRRPSSWANFDRMALAIAIALGLYVGLRLLESGFDEGDEIYSWNMWAIQHFLGAPIDYHYTQAHYPQLFPKILSYAYMLLGSIEAQTAVKTALVVLPVSIFFTIGITVEQKNDSRFLLLQAIIGLFILKAIELDTIFDEGMPDTLMAAALLASIFFFYQYRQNNNDRQFLLLSILTAITAALSKQPALVWALFSLPMLLGVLAVTKKIKLNDFLVGLTPALVAGLWIATEGDNFYNNEGVVTMSLGERGYLSQIIFSLERWLLNEPAIIILISVALFVAIRNRVGTSIIFLFTIPSMIIWFLFASYDIRAGAPALLSIALFIAYGNYGLRRHETTHALSLILDRPSVKYALLGGLFMLTTSGGVYELVKYKQKYELFQLGATDQNNLLRIFGADSGLIYDLIRTKDVKLWAPSNYIYGIFYGYTDVIRPRYDENTYDEKKLMDQIRAEMPDYLMNAGNISFGPGGKTLDRLATQICPALFERISGPQNRYRIITYRLNQSRLNSEYCDL